MVSETVVDLEVADVGVALVAEDVSLLSPRLALDRVRLRLR